MRAQDIRAMLLGSGLQVAYRSWSSEGAKPPPRPYLVYYSEGASAFFADDGNYTNMALWCAELYADQKDESLESKMEAVFAAHEIAYDKQEIAPTSEGAPLLVKYRFQTI